MHISKPIISSLIPIKFYRTERVYCCYFKNIISKFLLSIKQVFFYESGNSSGQCWKLMVCPRLSGMLNETIILVIHNCRSRESRYENQQLVNSVLQGDIEYKSRKASASTIPQVRHSQEKRPP